MNLKSLGSSIRERREALGLSQAKLAQLSGLSRQTLVGLEAGSLHDLGFNRVGEVLSVLGLGLAPPDTSARKTKRGLWMAAKTASVSYRDEIMPRQLGSALVHGEVAGPYVAHMVHLLDEAPVPLIVMAVEEAAEVAQVPPRKVWRNVGKLARDLEVHRRSLWV